MKQESNGPRTESGCGRRSGKHLRAAAGTGAQDIDSRRGDIDEASSSGAAEQVIRGVNRSHRNHVVERGGKAGLPVRTIVAGSGDNKGSFAKSAIDEFRQQLVLR